MFCCGPDCKYALNAEIRFLLFIFVVYLFFSVDKHVAFCAEHLFLTMSVLQIVSVPCWQLIGWISQMMALLDKPEAVAVHHVIEEIAECYPQALVYPFMISSENYIFEDSANGHRNQEFVEKYVLLQRFYIMMKRLRM